MKERRVILETENVIRQYRQYDLVVTAVNRASFRVFEGEFVAIIGPSGSGKSTLLHLCAGLDRPNSGTIQIRGNEITKMSPDELGQFRGKYIGMVFQNHNLIPQFTALENILVPTLMCNKPEYSYEQNLKTHCRARHSRPAAPFAERARRPAAAGGDSPRAHKPAAYVWPTSLPATLTERCR